MKSLTEYLCGVWADAEAQLRVIDAWRTAPDDHQVMIRSYARLATRVEALSALQVYADSHDGWIHECSDLFAQSVLAGIIDEPCVTALSEETRAELMRIATPCDSGIVDAYVGIGRALLESDGVNNRSVAVANEDDSAEQELRSATRKFAQETVAPRAESIHREDLLIPEDIISSMAELGYFGLSIPEEYDGVGMSNLMMVLATEELSAASLGAAGSLMTRPEILSKALLKGGTESQKAQWLPRIASGETMVAVAVTEPNVGSDVASVSCRATETELNGQAGYLLNGAKAWCTFAGRANILALLARTEDGAALGHKGLSLFIVEKNSHEGHEFVEQQDGGGKLTAKADATLGYRGMHSYTLQFDDYFVPAENLVGEEGGRGKGFYLQMDGFAAGRLQTGGRAVGLGQAALETTIQYAKNRPQFGQAISDYQNTQYEIGRMAVDLEAARQLTYAAARAMDSGAATANLMASMAKLFACRVAVNGTQKGQLMHGGWGYAEEYPISRYVVDALVLPIFEGVEPILELKVIGRGLLG